VAGLLGRLRDRLAAREDVVGVYVYGSLATGDLITKSEAISRLADFGVPDWLAQQVRRRRDGQPVTAGKTRRLSRALLTRRIMQDGIARLSRLDPSASR
jgi:hypothetical protein